MNKITLINDKQRVRTWLAERLQDESELGQPGALVYGAQQEGIITGLDGRAIELIFEPDDDGGSYLFTVSFPNRYAGQLPLTVTNPFRTTVTLTEGAANAQEAGLSVLKEAVTVANDVSERLEAFTAAYTLVVRHPDRSNGVQSDGNVVTVDIDLGSSFDEIPESDEVALSFVEGTLPQLDTVPTTSPIFDSALEELGSAVDEFPNALAVLDAYATTRRGSPRLVWALRDEQGNTIQEAAICSTCLHGEDEINTMVINAEQIEGSRVEGQNELRNVSDEKVTCFLCGYKHTPTISDSEAIKKLIADKIRAVYPAANRYGVTSADQGMSGYLLIGVGFTDLTIDVHSQRFTELSDDVDEDLGELAWGSFGDRDRDSSFDVDISTGTIIRT